MNKPEQSTPSTVDKINTVDLKTTYLGLELDSPLIVGASPLVNQPELVRKLEQAGAGAITLHSLFEEQITMDLEATSHHSSAHDNVFGEALTYFPSIEDFYAGPEDYLLKIKTTKQICHIPVIASLNGVTPGGWVDYALKIENAGADALELNFYHISTNPAEAGSEVEQRLIDIVMDVRGQVRLPLAVKLSPFYSALPHMCAKLQGAGADGVILFNRFYQPDIDIDLMETLPRLHLSDSSELPLRLRWIAALYGHIRTDLILSGGVHTTEDVIKGLMAGATGIQLVSSILKNGTDHLASLKSGLISWMEETGFQSLKELRGNMSMQNCPDPEAFERTNYMRVLQGWQI